jgi:hypothetical protein
MADVEENHGHPCYRTPTSEPKRRSGKKKTGIRRRLANMAAGHCERRSDFHTLE